MSTLLLKNARKIGMSSWEIWFGLECALVELHRLVNSVLFSFDIRQIVERVSMFWVELQSLFVAAFGFGDQKAVFQCISKVAICVWEVWLERKACFYTRISNDLPEA